MSPISLIIPAIFLLSTLLIGLWRGRGNQPGEYLLMDRTLGAPALIMSLVCGWYGGILGVSEYSYKYGLSNWFVFGVPYYIHALLFAIFLARRARNSRLFSIPDRLEQTYGKSAARTAALIIFFTTIPAAYLLMIGKTIEWIFGWSYPFSLLMGTLLSTLYIFGGGLRSVVRTDIPQFLIMYGGFAIFVIILYNAFGGLEFLHARVPAELFTPTGGQALPAVLVWYLIASTTLIEPLFYERAYAAKSAKVLLPSIIVAVLFWAIFDLMTTATGLYARALLPENIDPVFAFPELARQYLPPALLGLFLAAMLAVIMSTVDAYMFLAAAALGRDFFWRGAQDPIPEQQTRYVRFALFAALICSFVLALLNESVISLWHAVGSISAPALLIPVLAAWSKQRHFHRKWAVPAMITCALVSLLWRLSPTILESEHYLLNIEPIYVGLALSLTIYLLGLMRKSAS